MEINLNNYEVYIIDYLDGNLDALQTAELLLFLENNPSLKEDIEAIKDISVQPADKEVFGFKELLVQPPDKDALNLNTDNYSHYFIAEIENDLSPKGKAAVKNFLSLHSELVQEYNLFASCKLTPDKKVIFPNAGYLKVKTKKVYFRYYVATGIAASMLLLATVYFRLTPETEDSVNKTLQNSIEYQMNNANEPVSDKDKDEKSAAPVTSEDNTKSLKTKAPAKANLKSTPDSKNIKRTETPLKKLDRKGIIINTTSLMADNSSRNFYSGLYDDIRLSQELTLAAQEEKEQEAEEVRKNEKIKGVKAGRIINSVISTGEQLAEQVPESINGWLFADLGMKGFNLLTNNDYTINRRVNSKGNIDQIRIDKENKL